MEFSSVFQEIEYCYTFWSTTIEVLDFRLLDFFTNYISKVLDLKVLDLKY